MNPNSALFTPKYITLLPDEQVTIRLPEPTDAPKLIDYFNSLSEQTKGYFGPHPFDSATVNQICATLNLDECIRLVATSPDDQTIIAYALLQSGATPSDTARFKSIGTGIQPEIDYSFAPSIADTYQSRGLGGHLLQKALSIAQRMNKKWMILWGGVQANN